MLNKNVSINNMHDKDILMLLYGGFYLASVKFRDFEAKMYTNKKTQAFLILADANWCTKY